MKVALSKLAMAVALGTCFMAGASSANASLNSTLDGVFNDMMSNTSPPGAYESARRGVLSGGRYSARTKITRANLVYLDPPSISAGCGGIDIFGGSFSFINKDQLIQLARATAQNAAGLLFEVALKEMSPELADSVTKFLAKIQEMNDSMLDSCKMARGILTMDAPDEFTDTAKAAADVATAGAGVFDGIFDSFTSSGSNSSTREIADGSVNEETRENQLGNPLWTALKNSDVVPIFGGSADRFREEIMSLTGFIVYDASNTGEEGNVKPDYTTPSYGLTDILEGGDITIFDCSNSECTNYSDVQRPIKGMSDRLLEAFQGTSSSTGLVQRIRLGDSSVVNDAQIIMALPNNVSGILVNLIEKSESAAVSFMQDNADALALSATYNTAQQMIDIAIQAVQNSNHLHKEKVLQHIQVARDDLYKDYQSATGQYGEITDLLERGRSLLELTRQPYDGMSGLTQ